MIATIDNAVSEETCPTPSDLIQDIITLNNADEGASRFGSFSGTIYDTAWLSMITKHENGDYRPLFPECFEYILNSQQDYGVWGSTGSQIDSILNSLAGLLALVNRRELHLTKSQPHSLQERIEKAYKAVQKLLDGWNVDRTVHVGFEILVPGLLRQLEVFDLRFDFPGRLILTKLNQQKLEKFDPALLYSPVATTLLHSLEAFVGLVDFKKVGHHCRDESGIFGSPSATAAYLINTASWDERAERYLKTVVTASGGTGLVPSAYPTCLFELSWAVSTLLAPRVIYEQLTKAENRRLSRYFEKILDQQNGLVGFTPGVLEDADDTARCLISLQCLGKCPSPDRLIEVFQTENHFRTYKLEGSPSFSANCNVLLALLGSSQLDGYRQHIEKGLVFLLGLEESGPIIDKWNLSPQYTRMLFMQLLVALLEKYSSGYLRKLPENVIFQRVPSCVCRLLHQTLSTQRSDGSWSNSLEITAYSIITILYCLSLPWSAQLKVQLQNSMSRGREYLHSAYGSKAKSDYLWIEKVSYRSSLLHSTYCSTALYGRVIEHNWSGMIADLFTLRDGALKQTQRLVSNLPLFTGIKMPYFELGLVESNLSARRLKDSRSSLFSRDDIPMTADKYLDFIPMIWITCSYKNQTQISAEVLWEMLLLSLLNFQVDEYMESVVAKLPETELPLLTNLLKGEIDELRESTAAISASISSQKSHPYNNDELCDRTRAHPGSDAVDKAFNVLCRYIRHISRHRSVTQAPFSVQQEVLKELHNFLIAHIAHHQDNILLAESKELHVNDKTLQQGPTRHDYVDWVRSVASDDTSCPLSFLFFSCLISEPGKNCFEGARAKYLSKSLCRHLATMCRQYNDYGSAKRDAEEGNLNSLDFPDFKRSRAEGGDSHGNQSSGPVNGTNKRPEQHINTQEAIKDMSEELIVNGNGKRPADAMSTSAKEELMAIAEFERSCMELAKEKLVGLTSPSTLQKYQVFIDVTDMFGQVYVQKDIASRLKTQQQESH